MITITESATQQIASAAAQGNMHALALRIAATRRPDGSIDYKMGFDESRPEDIAIPCGEVTVTIATSDQPLLSGAILDFVEFEPGDFRFIFLNPNDPTYTPPAEDVSTHAL